MDDEVEELIDSYGPHAVVEAVLPLLSEQRTRRLQDVLGSRLSSVTIVLESLYDPHNGAAALRSAEALGVQDTHFVPGSLGDFEPSPEVTIHSDKWLDIHLHDDIDACASQLRGQGFRLLATVPDGDLALDDLTAEQPTAVLFGNEREGLSARARELADGLLAIPMYGFSQSFNLSVSVALVLRELTRRRREHIGAPGDLPAARAERLRARWYALGIRGLSDIVRRSVSE